MAANLVPLSPTCDSETDPFDSDDDSMVDSGSHPIWALSVTVWPFDRLADEVAHSLHPIPYKEVTHWDSSDNEDEASVLEYACVSVISGSVG